MFQLSQLVSKKNRYLYIFIQVLHRIFYIATPLISMKFIDSIVSSNIDSAFFYAILMFIFYLLVQLFNYLVDLFRGYTDRDVWTNTINIYNENMKLYSPSNEHLNEVEIHQNLSQNFEILRTFFIEKPVRIIVSAISIVVIIAILFWLSPILAILAIITVPVFILYSMRHSTNITKVTSDNINAMKDTRNFIIDQYMLSKEERFLDTKQLPSIEPYINNYEETANKRYKLEAFFDNILSFGTLNGIILVSTIISGILVLNGKLTIGGLTAVQLYISQLWSPAEFLLKTRREYLSIKRIKEQFLLALDTKKSFYCNDLVERIDIIGFTVLDEHNNVLTEELDFTFGLGETIIIHGDNGVGKTSLVEALIGLSNRYRGIIKLNDKIITESKVFSDILYIPADIYVSKFSLANFVNKSYGQKKIAQIKYALQSKKHYYIFDEPTNFLDKKNKEEIYRLIEELARTNVCVIIISHDPHFIENPKYKKLKISRLKNLPRNRMKQDNDKL